MTLDLPPLTPPARRVPLEPQATASDEARMHEQQLVERQRIGANIKAVRRAAGLSLRQMQYRSGVHANYLSELERGRRAATVDALVQIAWYLDTSIAALVGGHD
jgi:hypothetical protein